MDMGAPHFCLALSSMLNVILFSHIGVWLYKIEVFG